MIGKALRVLVVEDDSVVRAILSRVLGSMGLSCTLVGDGSAGLRALDEGVFVCMTADISNLAPRRAGMGVVSLAKVTGRPIVPVAYASSRRIDLDSWDRATINLPFSRAACAVGEIVEVPADADDKTLEAKRLGVEDALNEATRRAHAIVDMHHD